MSTPHWQLWLFPQEYISSFESIIILCSQPENIFFTVKFFNLNTNLGNVNESILSCVVSWWMLFPKEIKTPFGTFFLYDNLSNNSSYIKWENWVFLPFELLIFSSIFDFGKIFFLVFLGFGLKISFDNWAINVWL